MALLPCPRLAFERTSLPGRASHWTSMHAPQPSSGLRPAVAAIGWVGATATADQYGHS